MIPLDVPTHIDFREMSDALAWESKAMQRPFREDFFAAFADELRKINKPSLKILELGSGPGFLANFLLTDSLHTNSLRTDSLRTDSLRTDSLQTNMPGITLTLLDFSAAMHELARRRLHGRLDQVTFIEGSFKAPGWDAGLGKFDAVITNQAVHELRHKRYAAELHRQVKDLLNDSGVYLVCDHYYGEDGMQNDQLYMSQEEHRASLESAGYAVAEIMIKGGRALYRAT